MEIDMNITEAIINSEKQPAVNARELWAALEVKRQFSDWIKDRLVDFEEGSDYLFHKIVKQHPSGKKYMNEYFLTLDTAKHLAMLERNEIGKKIRQYFIEFEKEARKMIDENIKCCQKACMENVPQPANVIESTIAVIDKINQQILAGKDVDKEVLRYAWNIGKLIQQPLHKAVRAAMPDEFESWIWAYEPGEYTRGEVYADYCQSCENPMSARCFWPRFRKVRCCLDVRRANARYVVIR